MDFSRMEAQMEEYIQNKELAGGAIRIRKENSVVFEGKWGYADIENRRPVEYNTVYRLASMSKPVTAAAIMKLWEENRLTLDTPITEYFPGFKDMKVCSRRLAEDEVYQPDPNHPAGRAAVMPADMELVEAKRMVTVRDLLSHSSGLGMGGVGVGTAMTMYHKGDKLADRIHRWEKLPADFQPGEETGYSGIVGFDILGGIVEAVSGMDYQTYLRKTFFDPMELADLTFLLDEDQQKRLAVLYHAEDGKLTACDMEKEELKWCDAMRDGYFSGAGGLYGSLDAYDGFVQMLANKGEYKGRRILKEETVKKMHERGALKKLEMSPGGYWGLGMMVYEEPEKSGMKLFPGTFTWSGAYGTHFFIAPDQKIQVVFVMNQNNIGGAGSPISRKIEEIVFDVMRN